MPQEAKKKEKAKAAKAKKEAVAKPAAIKKAIKSPAAKKAARSTPSKAKTKAAAEEQPVSGKKRKASASEDKPAKVPRFHCNHSASSCQVLRKPITLRIWVQSCGSNVQQANCQKELQASSVESLLQKAKVQSKGKKSESEAATAVPKQWPPAEDVKADVEVIFQAGLDTGDEITMGTIYAELGELEPVNLACRGAKSNLHPIRL